MKANTKVLIMAGSVLLVGLLFLDNQKQPQSLSENIDLETEVETEYEFALENSEKNLKIQKLQNDKNDEPTDKLESIQNSKKTISLLATLSISENTNEDLIQTLRTLDLEPEVGSDKNEFTGELLMIRSTTEIPGVRYFHAQYFSTEDGGYHPQHMSFDIPPRPGNFQKAVNEVKNQFKINEPPTIERDGFIHWELKNGKAVHITVLNESQMKDSLWNAYDLKADKGTVKVTVEDMP